MITLDDYRGILQKDGRNLAEIRRNDAAKIVNQTFTGDIEYKRVYILDPDEGWHYTDAHFIKHSNVSISKDQVDTYLQFRPYEHHRIGSYIFIPDDTSPDLKIDEKDPLNGDTSNLWMIVGRNDANQFVRYMVLRCTYNFKWVATVNGKRQILSCWATPRNANSYTAGDWRGDLTDTLDNLTSAWFPNTFYIYGEQGLKKYGLADTRMLTMDMRLMITLNHINPTCYSVTKVLDMFPKGIIKYSIKQDEYDIHKDNADLLVCNYYSDTGDVQPELPEDDPSDNHTSSIVRMKLDDEGNLVEDADFDSSAATIEVGEKQYFRMVVDSDITAQWKVTVDNTDDKYTDDECSKLEDLMVIRQVDGTTIAIRAGKSYRLPNVKFKLSVSDINGDYSSSIELEVTK